MKTSLQLIGNRLGDTVVQRKRWQGREWLVFPAVMLREQVLNCLNCHEGGEFIPVDEMIASLPGWENRPVVILKHPMKGGQPVSANRRDVVERDQVGATFDCIVDGDSLKGDVWLDIAAMHRVLGGAHVLERLEAGEILEVSTGYFRNEEKKKGTHNGKPYALVQRNLIPDHFAIGLWDRGACSVADGCGTPRMNEGKKSDCGCGHGVPAVAQKSEQTETAGLKAKLQRVLDVAGEQFTALLMNATGDSPAAQNGGETANNQETPMRTKVIAILAAIAAVGLNAEQLDKKTDAELESLIDQHLKPEAAAPEGESTGGTEGATAAANAKSDCGCGGHGKATPAANAGTTTAAPAANAITAEDRALLTELRTVLGTDGVQGVTALLANAKAEAAEREQQTTALITELRANSRCAFSEEQLKAMDVAALRSLQRTLAPASFLGAGGPRTSMDTDEDAPPAPPAVLLAQKPAAGAAAAQ